MSGTGRVLPMAVAGVVLVLGAWGLDARDLAGDEVHMLVGDPLWIVDRALDPREGFVGHLPWSYWLRWVALSAFGDAAWVWRLHAVLGAALAAGLTARLAGVRLGGCGGAGAGLLVGLCPVLAFHAQDSSNYAWSAATGALVLGGLWSIAERRSQGALWLGAGLLVGGLNDVYFVFLALTVAFASAGLAFRRPETRRGLAAAWIPGLVVFIPAALLFAGRLLESHAGAVVDVHADPPAPSQLAWWADVPWRMLRRFLASSLGGYAAGRIDAPWEAVAPVVFGLLACAAAVRSRGRMAAVLLGSSLLLIVAIGLAFRGIADRTLPHEPRVFLTLLPALGCVWVAALQRLPRPLALSGAVLLTLSVGLPLAAQVATRSTMHRDAAALAAGAGPWLADAGLPLRELHVVVPDHRIHARLPHVIAPMGPGVRARQHRCIPDDASVIVLVRNEPLDVPATRPSCSGTRQPLAGHRLAAATSLGPPAHERNAASFLMPVQVEVWWPGLLPEGLPLARTLRLESALLDGIGPATEVGIRTGPAGGGGPERTVGSGPLGEGLDPVPISVLDEQVRLVFSPSAADLPETGLLDPLRREIQSTEAVLAAPLSLGDAPLRLAPFREPRLRVLLRLARIGLAVLAFLAVLWPGRRP